MANYPTLVVSELSERAVDDILMSRARSGGPKARRLFTGKKREFKVSHKDLTAAQRTTLESFFDTNRALTFNFTHPSTGVVYVVIFAGDGGYTYDWQTNNLATGSIVLAET